jgi:hypothetical protein
MLFKEIIAVSSENKMKPKNTLCGQNGEPPIVKLEGRYTVSKSGLKC